jgi:hypothetical protein
VVQSGVGLKTFTIIYLMPRPRSIEKERERGDNGARKSLRLFRHLRRVEKKVEASEREGAPPAERSLMKRFSRPSTLKKCATRHSFCCPVSARLAFSGKRDYAAKASLFNVQRHTFIRSHLGYAALLSN